MMIKCNACGQPGHGGMRCEQARRLAEHRASLDIATIKTVEVSKNTGLDKADLVVNSSKHGVYADKEKRREYRREYSREYMAKRRAAKRAALQN